MGDELLELLGGGLKKISFIFRIGGIGGIRRKKERVDGGFLGREFLGN